MQYANECNSQVKHSMITSWLYKNWPRRATSVRRKVHKRISETRSSKASMTGHRRTPASTTKPHFGYSNQHMQSTGSCKKASREITEQSPGVMLSIKQPQHKTKQPTHSNAPTQPSHTCPGCGARAHQGGCKACPAYNQLCHYCHKIGHYARVCQARLSQQTNPQAAEQEMRSRKMSTIRQVTAAEPSPTILIHISTNKRSYQMQVLPDSGADISAAGQDLLEYLDEHTDHLVLS